MVISATSVLTAAVLAQEKQQAIEYEDVIAGLASEYRKLGRQLPVGPESRQLGIRYGSSLDLQEKASIEQ